MNAKRRKEIEAVMERLDEVATEIRRIADDEREYYDNMPESIQGGERGERADEDATKLEEAADACVEQYRELGEVLNA